MDQAFAWDLTLPFPFPFPLPSPFFFAPFSSAEPVDAPEFGVGIAAPVSARQIFSLVCNSAVLSGLAKARFFVSPRSEARS